MYQSVVTETMGHLGKSVGIEGGQQEEISPTTKLDMDHRVPTFPPPLQNTRSNVNLPKLTTAHSMSSVITSTLI